MSEPTETRLNHARSSRERYRRFVQKYKQRQLEELSEDEQQREDSASTAKDPSASSSRRAQRGKRREQLREYLRWLRPHRYAIGALLVLALLAAGLELVEPLFMRFIIDRVLLNPGLDSASRLAQLNLAGALFVGVVVLSRLIEALKDYRQHLVNVRAMLSLASPCSSGCCTCHCRGCGT